MLSSSPSLLLSSLSPLSGAGSDAAPAGGDAAPGFAELLNGLAAGAAGAHSGEDAGTEATAAATPSPSKGKAIAAKAAAARGKDGLVPLALPATATEAATESGKILPVALPEATEGEAGADTDAVVAEPAATPFPLPVLPGALLVQAGSTEPATAIASRRPATTAQALARKVNPPAGQPADKAKPEAQASEPRPAQALAISVAAPVQALAAETAEAGAKPATPVRSKTFRAADLARIETPLPQMSAPAASTAHFTQADQAANIAAPVLPAMPSPSDIDAALDHLVAAREALMPAEAALAIDHAEFGEVSIKFEQSSDGSISAELTAADPELKRAVTAAVAATDRGFTATPDGDTGRSAQLASQRGSTTTTGGDSATGQRGQSGADREGPQQRGQARSQARQPATDQRSGVFA